MQLKCPNSNDFLFIGLTQYGASAASLMKQNETCTIHENDCLVTVDYLSNECNGLNSCNIQLDAQFLHTCKNLSDYLSVAYECIPGSKRIDICSNDETFIVDSNNLNSRFGNFYLTSPNYPNEYQSNLNNCSCKLEYVKIDDTTQKSNDKLNDKMNLVFKTYEFDLEEGEQTTADSVNTLHSEKCNKDSLNIQSFESAVNQQATDSLSLCGDHKEFKEFYMNGALIKMNLTSDDAITRRGFLIEIQPTPETICPYGTERFNSKKCIKYFQSENWYNAVESCKSKSGRLLTINDFVDNLKLNNILRSKATQNSIWSVYQASKQSHDEINFLNLKRSSLNKCISKSLSYWQDESCHKKLDYICEFDPISLNQNIIADNNRLIRVSCGSLSTVYQKSPSETTTKKVPKRKQAKPIISWSSLIDKNTIQLTTKKQKVQTIVSDLFTTTTIKTITEQDIQLKQEKLIIFDELKPNVTITITTTASPTVISQELALIIAIICGVSVVFIIVNVFCIWNYYNRKLKAYIEKSETSTEANYRTSTLISRNNKLINSNNRSMSTVDSYVKMLPTYETCINYVQSTANSSPNSTACLLNNTNEQLIKNYLQQKQAQDQHYYETLSNKNYLESENKICFLKDCLCGLKHLNNQFDSMIVVPVQTMQSAGSIQSSGSSAVVLMNNNSFRQLQHNSQQKPLITFISNDLTNSSQSTNTSMAASPAPAEL